MWSEKRQVESCMFLTRIPIIISIAANAMYFLEGCSDIDLQIVESINSFTMFGIIACCFFNFIIEGKKLSADERKKVSAKFLIFKLLGLVFIGYTIFAIFFMRDKNIIASAIIMCAGYINLYILKIKSKNVEKVNDVQKKWRVAYKKDSYEESNLSWRIKPMLTPYVSVKFDERFKNINWVAVLWAILLLSKVSFSIDDIHIIVLWWLMFGKDAFYFIDFVFGTYAQTEGICTGVVEKKEGRGSGRVYYVVYVTDFSNKREFRFKVYDYCNYKNQDNIRLVHGGFSKKIIRSKRMA